MDTLRFIKRFNSIVLPYTIECGTPTKMVLHLPMKPRHCV